MRYRFGIDFGTTNSSIAVLGSQADEPELIEVATITDYVPPFGKFLRSFARYFPDGSCPTQIGIRAQREYRNIISRRSENTRVMEDDHGTKYYPKIRAGIPVYNFKKELNLSEHARLEKRCDSGGSAGNADELGIMTSSMALREITVRRGNPNAKYERESLIACTSAIIIDLIAKARKLYGDPKGIVLGLPVTFGKNALEMIRLSLERGGVPTHESYLHFVWEPVAIALRNKRISSDNVLVFDFGGGTLDIALITGLKASGLRRRISKKQIRVGGLPLGGSDIDTEIMEILLKKPLFKKAVLDDFQRWYLLEGGTKSIEKAKIQLSMASEAKVEVRYWKTNTKSRTQDNEGKKILPFKTETLSKIIERHIPAIDKEIDSVLKKAGLPKGKVNSVIMAGGSSCLLRVQKYIKSKFPKADITFPDIRSKNAGIRTASLENALASTAKGLAIIGSDDKMLEALRLRLD